MTDTLDDMAGQTTNQPESDQKYLDEPCPRCQGTGKNGEESVLGYTDDPCYYCLGTGKRPFINAQPSKAPVTEQPIRKTVIGELSKVQLYAKDHSYDVTAGDEADIEHAANAIEALISSTYLPKSQVAGMVNTARIEELERYFVFLDDTADDRTPKEYKAERIAELKTLQQDSEAGK